MIRLQVLATLIDRAANTMNSQLEYAAQRALEKFVRDYPEIFGEEDAVH